MLSLATHFFMSYQFNASEMLLSNYRLNFYLNGSVLGCSHLLSTIVAFFVANSCPRRMGIIVGESVSLVIACALLGWMACLEEGECSESTKNKQTIALFVYRLLVGFSYDLFYMSQTEFFPSQIRSTAVLFTSLAMCVAVMLVPPLQSWFEANNWSIFTTFLLSSLGMLLCTIPFP